MSEFQMNKGPGHINVAHERGYFVGCKVFTFDNAEALNEFFAENKTLLCVDIYEAWGKLAVLVHRVIEAEEMAQYQEFSKQVDAKMQEWKQKQAEASQAEDIRKAKEQAELKRLAEVGKNYENNIKKGKAK
jgi:hypothetical protein